MSGATGASSDAELLKHEWLRTDEAAQLMRCVEKHVRYLIGMGFLPVKNIGGRRPSYRLNTRKIVEFMNEDVPA